MERQITYRIKKVKLYEMRPKVSTEAHKSEKFAELVCSNSLGGDHLGNASGLMKEELRRMGSLLIEVADQTKVPAGQALAVDREGFSEIITEKLKAMENIEIINEELKEIPKDKVVLVASGPLTSEALSKDIMKMLDQEYLYFYDAAAPIVTLESIDQDKVYYQSRYGKGDGEYINCPMNQEEYETFYNALITGERVPLKQFEEEKLFEACMPVERIAQRGIKTLLFGPLKPKGLVNPKTEGDKWDHAVVQLRQDDKDGKLYNLVGFQTNLKFGEQKRIFSMIPGLENAEFVRYGVMHRNTFIDSTKLLTPELNLKKNKDIYFAGQITGGEGYVCAMATGLVAAINIIRKFENKKPLILDDRSSIGAIIKYITEEKKNFQPMGPNFGVIKSLDERIRDKKEKYNKISTIALEYLEEKLSEDMN
ncbi:methylenetetrahydrofolate--tRNA-(uracil(54)-C(5))-methyltransferase (FADH(2)-oxidizing) TrmFO [uncultured Cetobacterium sp.]|uniref:methylenetetrahydrofolate--tRNA-(uracil(54)- C(5))-methyltransferase (FADH(2)-oxidizing) TrmFO n=1 Tax=uncultured Cetobacterium sp. TaxID=527638 RepID=UPI00262F9FE8|nr:methylenetetrahydrofolate--tRNA-(uracil(54)-C(5))-methyltransferase (FADH(2)-oxidizing) TrmFO [uncultured Cetobacterium sp.]